MKSLSLFAMAVIGFFVSTNSAGQDYAVKIIGIVEPTANLSPFATQMSKISTVLGNTPGLLGQVSIVYGNLGQPIIAPYTINGTSNESMRSNAVGAVMSDRNSHSADLVIVFVDQLFDGACGFAGLSIDHNWSGPAAAMQPFSGPDLRQKEDYFVALVSTEQHCRNINVLAAHEVGHLFGAGHEEAAGPYFKGLHSNSYADFLKPTSGQNNGTYTVMISKLSQPECGLNNVACTMIEEFSNATTLSTPNVTTYRNVTAIQYTRQSVSLFREVPTCNLTPPVWVSGQLLNHCYGGSPVSEHRVTWGDVCTSASDRYEVWAQQPPTLGSLGYDDYVALVYEPAQQQIIYVWGDSANIKVASCGGASCTQLSTSTYHADFEAECY